MLSISCKSEGNYELLDLDLIVTAFVVQKTI